MAGAVNQRTMKIAVVKNITKTRNIFTYFEFRGYDGWDEFDVILEAMTEKMGYKVLERLDGIYSRHCVLEKEGFAFKLMYHEDYGNCLCNQHKKDGSYYDRLERIAEEAVGVVEGALLQNQGT